MKFKAFVKHLESQGCEFKREGGNHTIYVNRKRSRSTAVPRHREINDGLCRKICRDLEVDPPGKT